MSDPGPAPLALPLFVPGEEALAEDMNQISEGAQGAIDVNVTQDGRLDTSEDRLDSGELVDSNHETRITALELGGTPPAPTDPIPGAVVMWAGQFDTEPAGWLRCNGTEYLIADYPELYAVIGTSYGGDGATLFAVPNLTSKVPRGADSVLTPGAEGGHAALERHSHGLGGHTHDIGHGHTNTVGNDSAEHTHMVDVQHDHGVAPVTGPSTDHLIDNTGGAWTVTGPGAQGWSNITTAGLTADVPPFVATRTSSGRSAAHNHIVTVDAHVGASGPTGGNAYTDWEGEGDGGNWPPYVTMIYMISTGVANAR